MFSHEYIPRSGLDALRNYKYKSGEYSWLDLKLNDFWLACAELLPRWLAPNLVTLIGTFHLFLIAASALVFDPTLEGKSPPWVYILNAWCVFVYQTMDAVDGKQARRTGSSSPLGQLFDHGCDALGTTFIAIGLCSLMGFGGSIYTIMILGTVQIPFYLCQWEENHVHVLRAQVGNFGVTEGQYLSVALNLITAAVGADFWKSTVSTLLLKFLGLSLPFPEIIMGTELRVLSVYLGGFFPFILAASTVVSVAQSGANFLRAVVLTFPLWLQQGLQITICMVEPAKTTFNQYPIPLIIVQGVLLSHLANRIIVASVCHLEFPLKHKILIPVPLIIGYIMYLNKNKISSDASVSAMNGILALYGAAIVIQFLHFVVNVTNSITTYLGIRCFTIVKQK